jgi:hypothetical protein
MYALRCSRVACVHDSIPAACNGGLSKNKTNRSRFEAERARSNLDRSLEPTFYGGQRCHLGVRKDVSQVPEPPGRLRAVRVLQVEDRMVVPLRLLRFLGSCLRQKLVQLLHCAANRPAAGRVYTRTTKRALLASPSATLTFIPPLQFFGRVA